MMSAVVVDREILGRWCVAFEYALEVQCRLIQVVTGKGNIMVRSALLHGELVAYVESQDDETFGR